MTTTPVYDDEIGWVRIEGALDGRRAADLAARCLRLADGIEDPRAGDKPRGGTRRLTAVDERLPDATEVAELAGRIAPAIDQILDQGWALTEIAFRCPGPGFGQQRLHADDLPRLEPGPDRCATAIVALVAFTDDNGSTAVVPGSHRRPDLQRQAGSLEDHVAAERLIGPAGTAFVFTGHLLHGGTENRSDSPRPALQLSYRAP